MSSGYIDGLHAGDYGYGGEIRPPRRSAPPRDKTAWKKKPATQPQIDLVRKLAAEQGLPSPSDEQIAQWNGEKASEVIDWFIARAKKLRATKGAPVAPKVDEYPNLLHNCHYALPGLNPGDKPRKFKVQKPKRGKWVGYTFINGVDGERFDRSTSRALLAELEADWAAALSLYGHSTNKCGNCRLPLELKESVERGYGETCAKNLGLPYNRKNVW